MEEGGWGRGDGEVRGDEGRCGRRIKYEITRMEFVEHKNTIGHIVMNKDGIEDFWSVYVLIKVIFYWT